MDRKIKRRVCMFTTLTVVYIAGYLLVTYYKNEKIIYTTYNSRSQYSIFSGNSKSTSRTENIDMSHMSLTGHEEARIKTCAHNLSLKVRYDSARKFLTLNKSLCWTHHTYLKGNTSFLIEVGGNKGDDSEKFQNIYSPKHIILEPVLIYYNRLTERFKENRRVTVLNFGLGNVSKQVNVVVHEPGGLGTSIYENKNGSTEITIVNAIEFFKNIGVGQTEVDLLFLDCEGCEYIVLECLIKANMIQFFKNIQFEGHSHLPGIKLPFQRYCTICELLSRTHRPTFRFILYYENWRRTDLP
ncbi:uncharacterized protein LOC128552711 [Mercenaria mercenaria]|uniref:uncharacterized protein LOC128552711 n=1 Tax=Mercenaria mercenaria TaxID=6596 RepID=UPI00234F4CFE|nr:uncharacterized protein LOC128552711 [Mercenaria mercenaria]